MNKLQEFVREKVKRDCGFRETSMISLTLGKILQSIQSRYPKELPEEARYLNTCHIMSVFKWKFFINNNESEFELQTPETQLAIAKLLGYEE